MFYKPFDFFEHSHKTSTGKAGKSVASSQGLPAVSRQQDRPGQGLPQFGEERRLEQTSDLIPASQRLSGRRGEPHCRPADTDGEGGFRVLTSSPPWLQRDHDD